ncbi:MAG TPA: MFS transporter [Euzebyales bacterium]|nr:MFS transporter [Euzebyales bacterium]
MRRLQAALRDETAIAVTFLVNGVVFASLLPRLPQIKAQLDLGDAAFGLALMGAGLGGLAGSLLAPRIMRRLSERRTVIVAGVALALSGLAPPVVATAPAGTAAPVLALGLAVLLIGLSDAVHDVSMNVVALGAQRRRGTTIMGRLHGLWSAGAVAAGAVGALAAAHDVPVLLHLAAACSLAALAQLFVAPALPRVSTPAVAVPSGPGVRRAAPWAVLAVVGVAAALIEGPPQEWSAVYLFEGLGTGPGLAGMAPVSFTAAMLVSRLLADRWIDRWGAAAVARAAGVIVAAGAALGLWVSGTTGSPLAALVGFAIVGFGAAPVFPLMFMAAERLPGMAHGSGVGAVSAVARAGFLGVSPLIGVVSEAVGLAWALSVIALGGLAATVALPPRLAPPAGDAAAEAPART